MRITINIKELKPNLWVNLRSGNGNGIHLTQLEDGMLQLSYVDARDESLDKEFLVDAELGLINGLVAAYESLPVIPSGLAFDSSKYKDRDMLSVSRRKIRTEEL